MSSSATFMAWIRALSERASNLLLLLLSVMSSSGTLVKAKTPCWRASLLLLLCMVKKGELRANNNFDGLDQIMYGGSVV